MFYRYEIRNNGKEDILYLYLDMREEFSKELGRTASNEDLSRRTKNFIRNNNINFKGNKVFLIVDGIIVRTLDISDKENIIDISANRNYSDNEYLVTLKLGDNSFIELSLKEYLLGVLGSFYFLKIEKEVFKTLAVLFRTYAYKMMEEKHFIEANSYFVSFSSIDNYRLIWDKEYNKIYNFLQEAIKETEFRFLMYNKNYILPFIHYCNDGVTCSSQNYPYLKKVNSLWDLSAPYYIESKEFKYEELSSLLGVDLKSNVRFDILEMENKKFIKRVKINNKVFTGEELVDKLDLKSLDVTFLFTSKGLKTITRGWGNFLGLSIFGANELAKNNCNYISILNYYFPTVRIMRYEKNFQ